MRAMIGLCLALSAWGQGENSAEYRAAYALGGEEATQELRDGRATIYAYGLLRDSLDRETGLRFEAIAGCCVDDAILGRAAGHNDRIKEHIRAHGLPGNSLKRWEDELFDLKGYFARRSKMVEPHPMVAGDAPVKSNDGRYTLALREIPIERRIRPEMRLEMLVTRDDASRIVPMHPIGAEAGKTEFFWGPQARLAFFRWREYPEGHFADQVIGVLDLDSGRWVRQEIENRRLPDPAPEPRSGPSGT